MEESDTRTVTARSLKHPCTQDPSKNTHIPEVQAFLKETHRHIPMARTIQTWATSQKHKHMHTHTILQMHHNCWTSLERQTQDPIHTPGTFPKTVRPQTHASLDPHTLGNKSPWQTQAQPWPPPGPVT